MAKITVSLSTPAYERLGSWVRDHNSNPSVVTEAALLRFADLSDRERNRAIQHLMATKKATDRTGWMRLFWDGYAEEFGTVNFDRDGSQFTVLRQYDGFDTIWLQLPPAPEHDKTAILHVQESPPVVAGVETITQRFAYTIDYSPFTAAAEVAAWVRKQQPRAEALRAERRRLVQLV